MDRNTEYEISIKLDELHGCIEVTMDIENRAKKNSAEDPTGELEMIMMEVLGHSAPAEREGNATAEIDEIMLEDIKEKYKDLIRKKYSKINTCPAKLVESMVDVIKERKCLKGYGKHVEINDFGKYCAENYGNKPCNGNQDKAGKDSIYFGVCLKFKGLAEIIKENGKKYIIFIPKK